MLVIACNKKAISALLSCTRRSDKCEIKEKLGHLNSGSMVFYLNHSILSCVGGNVKSEIR